MPFEIMCQEKHHILKLKCCSFISKQGHHDSTEAVHSPSFLFLFYTLDEFSEKHLSVEKSELIK